MEQVVAVLRHTGARPDRLKLELTESLALDNVDDTIAKMNALRALGLRFSMDDFGTGQSSLSYLTRLPLDQRKIDQSFVRNIGIQHTDALIVQTIIGMAQSLGIDVIAEGGGYRGAARVSGAPRLHAVAGLPVQPPGAHRGAGAAAAQRAGLAGVVVVLHHPKPPCSGPAGGSWPAPG